MREVAMSLTEEAIDVHRNRSIVELVPITYSHRSIPCVIKEVKLFLSMRFQSLSRVQVVIILPKLRIVGTLLFRFDWQLRFDYLRQPQGHIRSNGAMSIIPA